MLGGGRLRRYNPVKCTASFSVQIVYICLLILGILSTRRIRMSDLANISFRTVLLYVIILIVLRIMGKREVGELGVLDVVVFIIMAEVAALAIESPEERLIDSIIPIIILLAIQL